MKIGKLVPLALLAATFLLSAAGCSTLPIAGPLPHNLTAEKIAAVDDGAPFAISPDSAVVAHVAAGLKLLHLPTGQVTEVSPQRPQQLAWSPGGNSLAASHDRDGKSVITIYDRHGSRVTEAVFDDRITGLAWLSENELLAASVRFTNYSFGSNFKTVLHRWQPGKGGPSATVLRDTTLRKFTVNHWQTSLARGPMLDLSRAAGLILYLHPVDPPLFNPYYKLILRDLASGRELEVALLGLASHGGRFSRSGEELYFGDGSVTTVHNPWTDVTRGTITTRGKNLELSPAGSYWFADGSLYRGEALEAGLAPDGVGRFTPDGRQLLVAGNGDLYRLAGLLPADDNPLDPQQLEELARLRSWRIEGLITPREYRESSERINGPGGHQGRGGPAAAPGESEELRVLQRKLEQGALTPAEFELEKKKLPDDFLRGRK